MGLLSRRSVAVWWGFSDIAIVNGMISGRTLSRSVLFYAMKRLIGVGSDKGVLFYVINKRIIVKRGMLRVFGGDESLRNK
jgi:hypothetical protein